MKRSIITILSCAALICAFALPSIMAADNPEPPSGDMFKGFEWPEGRKTVATFDHANHRQPCETCHHKWDGSSEITGCTVDGCHDDFKDKRTDASAYKAFHDRRSEASCLGCHKSMKKGPTKCSDCHPRKK
jgi:hypothetical protein